MPTPTSTRWIDTLLQRIDRIRRAHNLCELQRSTYTIVAAALAGGTMLLVTALFGSTRLFAVVAWSTVAAFVVTTALLVRETTSRWLRREHAVAWIESRSALGGRLRSLIELHARGEDAGTRFFLPLLRAENERALPSWEPTRIVPRRVPWVALALALITTCALLAALTLAPVLHPRIPALAGADMGVPVPRAPTEVERGGGADDHRSPLASIAADVQEQIRQSIWGQAWDRVREALAEAQRGRQRMVGGGAFDRPGAEDDTEGPWQLAKRGPSDERPPSRGRENASIDEGTTSPPVAAPHRALERTDSATAQGGRAGAGAGAGTGTSPDLYGATAPPELASHARFELGLVTRMRLKHRQGVPGHVRPARSPDQQPALAGSDRRDQLAHEMTVPRAYEPIVRQVFAHRDAEGIE